MKDIEEIESHAESVYLAIENCIFRCLEFSFGEKAKDSMGEALNNLEIEFPFLIREDDDE